MTADRGQEERNVHVHRLTSHEYKAHSLHWEALRTSPDRQRYICRLWWLAGKWRLGLEPWFIFPHRPGKTDR